jgi:hypothetical protein
VEEIRAEAEVPRELVKLGVARARRDDAVDVARLEPGVGDRRARRLELERKEWTLRAPLVARLADADDGD